MILVTGSAVAGPGSLDEALRLSLEHVRRSRQEPGCVSHAVHVDAEDPMRLVFAEVWEDADSLRAHFELPASVAFVIALTPLLVGPPTMEVYEASPTRV